MFGKRLINTGGEVAIPYFNTVTYTGNGSTQSISGVGFQPDMVWVKSRSAATSHKLTDVVRGATKGLIVNSDVPETTDANGLTAFGSDGFTLGSDSVYNNSGATYVAWCFKANGAAVTNTDGSITSEVSANVDAGFSIVSYTGNGSDATIGTGLNEVPDVVITRGRANIALYNGWAFYHKDLTFNYHLYLDSTQASINGNGNYFRPGSFTSSVFAVGGDIYGPNVNGTTMVAYCFSEKAGFSKFGSYTGNGSATGPTVTTGFEPAFVMIKRTDVAAPWVIIDNKRSPSNPRQLILLPDVSDAELNVGNAINFNSTDFQLTDVNYTRNASGATYIYMAFANQF